MVKTKKLWRRTICQPRRVVNGDDLTSKKDERCRRRFDRVSAVPLIRSRKLCLALAAGAPLIAFVMTVPETTSAKDLQRYVSGKYLFDLQRIGMTNQPRRKLIG